MVLHVGAQHGPVVCHHAIRASTMPTRDAEEGHSDLQALVGDMVVPGSGHLGSVGRVLSWPVGQLGWGCGQWLQPGVEAKFSVPG